jgi:hypothetical protein
MCLYPKLIPNPKYRTSKKRGYYKPSPHDARLNYVPVACGKCYECRKKKAREWRIRLAEEIRHNKSYFVTLTIDDDNLEMLKNELEVETVKENENNIATPSCLSSTARTSSLASLHASERTTTNFVAVYSLRCLSVDIFIHIPSLSVHASLFF